MTYVVIPTEIIENEASHEFKAGIDTVNVPLIVDKMVVSIHYSTLEIIKVLFCIWFLVSVGNMSLPDHDWRVQGMFKKFNSLV